MSDTVLLTGATGFVGSHLLQRLVSDGFQVVVLKRSTSDTFRIQHLLEEVSLWDVDRCEMKEIFRSTPSIDLVIHTATSYSRTENERHQAGESNLCFPLKLLGAATDANVPVFINTDTFFTKSGRIDEVLFDYSLSKRQFAEWGTAYAAARRIAFASLRLEHVFGPLDADSKFVPRVLRSLISGNERLELTPGNQRRDFVYVADVVSAYMLLIRHWQMGLSVGGEYEVGRGKSTSIREFVETARRIVASPTQLCFGALPSREGELLDSKADTTRLAQLGWTAKVDIENGLRRTLDGMMIAASSLS